MESEQPFLAKLSGPSRRLLDELDRVFVGHLEMPSQSSQPFATWSHEREALADLLVQIGDRYSAQPENALVRFAIATVVDFRNSAGAARLAGVLSRDPGLMKKHGQLLDSWVSGAFGEKMAAYRRGDAREILRLHVTLGDFFVQQKVWGPPSNARSAVFQLEHALRAEEAGRRAGIAFPVMPGIPLRLADAYEGLGDPQKACAAFGLASARFQKAGQTPPVALASGRQCPPL